MNDRNGQALTQARRALAKAILDETKVSSTAVFVINVLGSIVQTNSAALRLLDSEMDKVVGHCYSRFFSVADGQAELNGNPGFADPVLRCLMRGKPCLSAVGQAFGEDGTVRRLECSVAPIYNELREIKGAILIVSWEGAELSSW